MDDTAPGHGLRALARFAASVDARTLPADVVEKARSCLLYAMAVGVASLRAPQPAQAARVLDADGAATRFVDGARRDALAAALANGTLFHARVQDDAHPAGHVGVVVVPAALAVAETVAANGADLLAALVAGYETALRIGRDHTSHASARGLRSTPLYGVFGAAAAVGRLMRLDARAMRHALGLAANLAGGLREYSEAGSEDYAFQAGTAAANGILAARLAAAGATSADTALEGKAGFFRALGEADVDYAARLADGLGRDFAMLDVTYKPYPICQFHRGVVRGCIALRERAGAHGPDSIAIRMHPFEGDFFGVRFAGPFETFPQTFMSAPFCVALAWTRGDVTLAGLTDFAAPDVNALVPRVTIVSDASRARYAPRIEAHLAGGPMLEWEEVEGADAYRLNWNAAVRMTALLTREAGAASDAAQHLVAAVQTLDATLLTDLIDAMRDACASAPRSSP